jgi:hypothetical protein
LAIYTVVLHLPAPAVESLILTAALGSIPVALPATFTLAAAIGAKSLAKSVVLPTRLSAVDEAGTMDVPCVDIASRGAEVICGAPASTEGTGLDGPPLAARWLVNPHVRLQRSAIRRRCVSRDATLQIDRE